MYLQCVHVLCAWTSYSEKKNLHTANRITKSSGQYHKPYTVQCLHLPGTHSCSFIQTEGVIQQIGFGGAYAAQVVPRKYSSYCSRTKSSEKLSHHQLGGFHHQLAGFHRLVLFPVLEGSFFAARFLNMLGVVTGYWYFASFALVGFDVAFQDAQTPQTIRNMP